jgi:UDP-GlcNAc:undecaprenyl-phosphate GlcNAc-1-phosphate transferase
MDMDMDINVIILSLVSFSSSFVFLSLLRPFAFKVKLVDCPNEYRKHHKESTPLIGGLCIFLSFIFTILVSDLDLNDIRGALLALSIVTIIGVLDDLKDIPVSIRLIVQIFSILLLCTMSGVVIHELGDFVDTGTIQLNNWSIPFTIFAIIGLMNAINLIDGIDGLAAGVSLISLIAITIAKIINGNIPQIPIILSASIAAFLWFNIFSKKKTFLGDAGSTFLGLAIAWALIDSSQGENNCIKPITTLWLVSLPILDTLAIMIRRIKKGQSPFKADRDHLHHIFMRAGFTDRSTLAFLLSLSSLFAGIGLLLNHLNTNALLQTLILASFLLIYFQLINNSWRLTKLFR